MRNLIATLAVWLLAAAPAQAREFTIGNVTCVSQDHLFFWLGMSFIGGVFVGGAIVRAGLHRK